MAEPKEILFRNWIKAGLGLLYVKEGIQDFIVDEISNFHSIVLGTIPGAGRCTIHTIQNVLRCPTTGICSGRSCRFHNNTDPGKTYTPCLICKAIRKEIEKAHRYGKPSYNNTRSEIWCTSSWELAKCFMPAQGYSDKNTADDTDLPGLISVILNNKDFQNKITENLGQHGNKFEKVRNARNDIMHNAKMETRTTDLNSYFNILNDVLNDSKHLQGLTKVKDAKDKLYQLQSDLITITTEDEQMIREESLKALERKTEECMYEIDKKKDEIVLEIDNKKEDYVQVIDKKKDESIQEIVQEIDTKKEDCIHEIDKKKDESIQEIVKEIDTKKEDCVQVIDKMKEESIQEIVQEIDNKKEDCFQVIDNKKDESIQEIVQEIDTKKEDCIHEIDKKKDESIQEIVKEIDTKKEDCVQVIDKMKEESIQEIVQEIDNKKEDCFQVIDNKKDESIQEIVQEIDTKKEDCIHEIDKKKDESIQEIVKEIDTKKEDCVQVIDKMKEESIQEIVQEIDNKKEDCFQVIDNKKDESIQEIVQEIDTKKEESIQEFGKIKEEGIKEFNRNVTEGIVRTEKMLEEKIQAGVNKTTEAEAVKRQQNEREHMHIPADKEYKRKTDELKKEIVDHYIDNGYCVSSIPVLVDGDETLVDDFFMMPEMKRVKPATNKSNVDSISSIHGLFLKDKLRIRKVCIVGEAGQGKTTLCQKMISSWCTIHKNKESATNSEPANRSFDNDDQQFLKSFKFLFYIPLRNHKTSNVVEMIKNELVKTDLHDLLDEVLRKESDSCLVILDGLDEWTAEKDNTGTLPNLDKREKFSVIITTRPWKLEVLRPKQPAIGQEIELNGIANKNLFVENVLKVLDRKLHKEYKTSDGFIYHISLNKMTNLIGIPLICTQLICMWYDDLLDCRYTQTEIYFEMIEYLFHVADRRQQEPYQTVLPESQVSIKHSSVHSLHIFKGRTHCQKYGQLLVNLSELAYCTLFNEERENALVFKHSLSEIHNLTEIDVQFCLKVGLLSQAKYCSEVISPSKKLSFLHKTFQELLAAMHIANFDDDGLMSMLQTFKCLNDVHEMTQVLVFLSGMRPDCVGALSRQIAELADKDEIVLEERQSLYLGSISSLRDRTLTIQSVLSDCIKEGYRDGTFPDELVVHDIDFLRHAVVNDVFAVNVKSVLQCLNTMKIKSLYVDSEMLKDIDGQTRNIVKLHVTEVSSQRRVIDLTSLIKGCVPSLACLYVEGSLHVNMDDFILIIHTLNHITRIGLYMINLSHSNIENLAKYLSGGTQLKEIMLNLICCTSCEQNQCFYKIDLLRHKTLNYLSLQYLEGHVEIGQGIPFTKCKLKRVNIGMSFVECLENSTSLQVLLLSSTYYPQVMQTTNSSINTGYQKMLGVVLPTLKNLRYFQLEGMDCGQELLNCSQLTSLEEIRLMVVTMTLECVQCFVDSLSQTNNEIYISMICVIVIPKHDLSAVKEYILNKWGIGLDKEDGDAGTFDLTTRIDLSRTPYVQTDSEN